LTGQQGADEPDKPVLSRLAVARLLVVLAAASGCLDVFCVTQLGGFFASVITGNLVQLGRAIATVDTGLLARGTTAVGSYVLGVAGSTVWLVRARSGWYRRTGAIAVAEAMLLVGVAAGWQGTAARPGHAAGLALLGAASAASGMQSVVTINSGIGGASTTYLTGTLTDVVRNVVLDPHRFAAGRGALSRLLGLLGGAVLGALMLQAAPTWAPTLAAALILGALVGAAGAAGRMARTTDRRGRE
jgi:uncharacterized membrane protein YoaK (UPF0700 family)